MKRELQQAIAGDLSGVTGDLTGVTGNLSGVRGDLSGVIGDLTGVTGDLDAEEKRRKEKKAYAENVRRKKQNAGPAIDSILDEANENICRYLDLICGSQEVDDVLEKATQEICDRLSIERKLDD